MSQKRKRDLPPVPLFHEMSSYEQWFLAAIERQKKAQAGLDKLVNELDKDLREFMAELREAPVQRAVSSCGQLEKETGEDEQGAEMEPEPEFGEDSVVDLANENSLEGVAVFDLAPDSFPEEVADEHSRPRGSRMRTVAFADVLSGMLSSWGVPFTDPESLPPPRN